MNSVKVVMGFLELAAALKFFRTGELVLSVQPSLFTYDLVLGMYVAISFLAGLYLLNVYRLPHDTPAEHLGVPRLVFSFLFLSLGLYLTPGLFKYGNQGESQRPAGQVFAWLDSFLLPEPRDDDGSQPPTGPSSEKSASLPQGNELEWIGSLDTGLGDALKEGKLVFVDFTGLTCTNCKFNEKSVFSRADIRTLLRQYRLVQLYTDRVPNRLFPPQERALLGEGVERQREVALANLRFQREKFDTEQLPLYVILRPRVDGGFTEVSRYAEGKINDESAFAQFLRTPLQENDHAVRTEARLN
jgi:thiol:disulfide interchange protein DsbD